MRPLTAVAPALLAVCVACATVGRSIDTDLVSQLQPQVSTQADAIHLLGKPGTTSTTSGGNTVLMWTYAHAVTFGGADSTVVSLTFGADGLLASKTVSSSHI